MPLYDSVPRQPRRSGIRPGIIALWAVIGVVILVAVIIGGYQLGWWLKADRVDRQVGIDNRNLGTQTAWRDEALGNIITIETLPEDAPARITLTRRACELIGRLSDSYISDDLASFQTQECM